jgi:hypothetical protein
MTREPAAEVEHRWDRPLVVPLRRDGPLFEPKMFEDIKDPCPAYDGKYWHIFGSGGSSRSERWTILHAVAQDLDGHWVQLPPSRLLGVHGDHVAAPGVIHDGAWLHMFVQTDFAALGGTVEHLVSDDGGLTFTRIDTALESLRDSPEAGIYDPQPAHIAGHKYLVYSGTPTIGAPDLFLAQSVTGSWNGPWERLGPILRHEDVPHHNARDDPDYEWGLEGAQLIELPDGRVLLNAVCFLPGGTRGTRQRVFFALAEDVEGPYRTIGPVLPPSFEGWEAGENGHATVVLRGRRLVVLYQARSGAAGNWRYGVAEFDADSLG